MSVKDRDLKKLIKREKTFSTLAHKEGLGAAKRAKKEKDEGYEKSAKDSRWEAKVDEMWSRKRAKIAAKAKAAANRFKRAHNTRNDRAKA